MAFSLEDRRKVCDFFIRILLKNNGPIHYERLRGHISAAEPVVVKYVRKKCNGENLFKYFQTHPNHFNVYPRVEEVSINESRRAFLLKKHCGAEKVVESAEITETDSVCNEEVNTNSDHRDYSRSSSFNSTHRATLSSVEKVEDDSYSAVLADEKKAEYEKITIKYFSDFLERKGKIKLKSIQAENLPLQVKSCINRYRGKKIASFFKNNPEIFHIDSSNYVTLVTPPVLVKNSDTEKVQHDKCPSHSKVDENVCAQSNEAKTVDDFLQCAEFFVNLLKKKSLPLNNLSGRLSHAPPSVLEYLVSNYDTFRHFLVESDKLFILNEDNEVSLAKDGIKLLKQARKLLNSDAGYPSVTLKSVVNSLFQSEHSAKENSTSEIEFADVSFSKQDIFPLTENKKQNIKEFQTSDNEKFPCTQQSSDENTSFEKTQAQKMTDGQKSNNHPVGKDMQLLQDNPVLDRGDRKAMNAACDVTDEGFENPCSHDESSLFEIRRKTQRLFIECAFTVQLLCLEVVEKEYAMCQKFEYDAVKFFVEILEKLPRNSSDLVSLEGSLEQAPVDVKCFMKQLYKREKFSSFFEKYDEFILSSQNALYLTVRLSPSYRDYLEDKRKVHEVVSGTNNVYSIHKLYTSRLHDVFTDVFDCLSKICCFLQNKSRTDFNRLSGIYSKFSVSQQDFINSFSGSVKFEKFEKFLCCFPFFIFSNDCVKIDPDLDVSMLVNSISRFSKKLSMVRKCDKSKLPCFDHLSDYSLTYEHKNFSSPKFNDLKRSVIEYIEIFLSAISFLDYSDLPNIVGYDVILSLVLENKDSQSLIQFLEESTSFQLKNGQVCQKKKDPEEKKFSERALSKIEDALQHFDAEKVEICSEGLKSKGSEAASFIENNFIEEEQNDLKCKDECLKAFTLCTDDNGRITDDSDVLKFRDTKDNVSSTLLWESPVLDSEFNTYTSSYPISDSHEVERIKIFDSANGNIELDQKLVNEFNDSQHLKKWRSVELHKNTSKTGVNGIDSDRSCEKVVHKSVPLSNIISEENSETFPLKNPSLCKKSEDEVCDVGPCFSSIDENSVVGDCNENSCSDLKFVDQNCTENTSLEKKKKSKKLKDAEILRRLEELEELSMSVSKWEKEGDGILDHNTPENNPDNLEISKLHLADDSKKNIHIKELKKQQENKRNNACEELENVVSVSSKNQNVFDINEHDEKGLKPKRLVCKRNSELNMNDVESKDKEITDQKVLKSGSKDKENVHFGNSTDQSSFKFANTKILENEENDDPNLKYSNCLLLQKACKTTINKDIEEKFELKNKLDHKQNISSNIVLRNKNELTEKTGNENDSSFSFSTEGEHCKIAFPAESSKPCQISDSLSRDSPKKSDKKTIYKSTENVNEHLCFLGENKFALSNLSSHFITDSTEISKVKCSSKEKYSESSVESGIHSGDETSSYVEKAEKVTNATPDSISSRYVLTSPDSRQRNCASDQTRAVSSNEDSLSVDQQFFVSSTPKKDKDDKPHGNSNALFLQPLKGTVILVTLDSCIVETAIESHKKYVFCLKSSFHCDQHTDCSECFDSLAVGDEVSCYIPPAVDFQCGNMCFSFMLCKDPVAKDKEPKLAFAPSYKEVHKKYKYDPKESSLSKNHISTYKNNASYDVLKPKYVQSMIAECQTDLSGEVKPLSCVVEKECQVKCSTVSRDSQTDIEKQCSRCEKGCQVKCTTVSRYSQTTSNTFEVECQTDLTGKVKPYPPVCEKACQVKHPTLSQEIQTVTQSVEIECQTSISGRIKSCVDTSSSKFQTLLSGEVKGCVSLADVSCQTLPHSSPVTETKPANNDFTLKSQSDYFHGSSTACDFPSHIDVNATTVGGYSPVKQKVTCDMACQTLSTGPIMIKKYCL